MEDLPNFLFFIKIVLIIIYKRFMEEKAKYLNLFKFHLILMFSALEHEVVEGGARTRQEKMKR